MGSREGAPALGEALALGFIGVFFSFGGFWEASRVAAEVREPGRTVPLALAAGVVSVTIAYVVTTMAFMYLVPAREATTATDFARRAGEMMFGSAGPLGLASIVVLSVTVSLMALLMMAPRLYVAMSRDGLFLPALAKVHPGTGAPARATVLLAALASLFVIMGTFDQIVAFFICTALSFVALAAAALFVVRGRATAQSAFQTPGYPLAPALFVGLVVVVVVMVGVNRPLQALAGAALVLVGIPTYRSVRSERSDRSGGSDRSGDRLPEK
jgi:APA family basic amino acid/polyamine antiporter